MFHLLYVLFLDLVSSVMDYRTGCTQKMPMYQLTSVAQSPLISGMIAACSHGPGNKVTGQQVSIRPAVTLNIVSTVQSHLSSQMPEYSVRLAVRHFWGKPLC